MFVAIALGSPAFARQQPAEQTGGQQETDNAVVTGEGPVGVDERPADLRIEARLQEILDATGRFTDLAVDVRDGVVFLEGQSARADDRTLASDLARRVDGVAAVVNNLTVELDPVWTLEPARRELLVLAREFIRILPLLVLGVGVLALFALAARLVSRGAVRLLAGSTESELLANVLRKAVFLVVLVLGIYLALRITGLTRIALTVVSGTGLLGLALGFAFRDIAENFLASLLLSIQRPFRLGDVIEVDGHVGVVRKVTSRGTLLIDFDGNHIQIANAPVYKNAIKNYPANPKVRTHFVVGIGYDDDITAAQEVARRVLQEHPAVLADPEPLVLVDELGSSTVNLRIYFWIDGTAHSMLKMQSSVIRLTVGALASAGISMPDEAREVIFPQGVPVDLAHAATTSDGAARRAGDRRGPAPAREVPSSTEVVVHAEGNLTTETHDLNRQADEARDPEGGADVLGGEHRASDPAPQQSGATKGR